jgi:Arc/MetJ-type ribon-helix-helix transcriptional regulator
VQNAVNSAGAPSPPTQFLGVRLTLEELDRLDRLRRTLESPTRSDAVRALLRAADRISQPALEVPAALEAQLDELVDDGWAGDRGEALTLALNLGLSELAKIHGERMDALHRRAKDLGERDRARRRADREGGGLLER